MFSPIALGSAQDGSLSSTTGSSADRSVDTDGVCSIGRSKVLPTQSIRPLARKGREFTLEVEGPGFEDRECCLQQSSHFGSIMMQSCGFEMLYQESGARGHNSNTSLTEMDAAVSERWVSSIA